MMPHGQVVCAALLLGLATALTVARPQAAAAKIVAQPQLATFCTGEAAGRLKTRPANLIVLPVEKTHGVFHVYGQTEAAPIRLFECTFDAKGNYLGIDIKGNHDHESPAAAGAPRAAINKCLQMVGVPARVVQVSPMRPGHFEIVIREKASSRKVACTVPADGGEIEDWVEMN